MTVITRSMSARLLAARQEAERLVEVEQEVDLQEEAIPFVGHRDVRAGGAPLSRNLIFCLSLIGTALLMFIGFGLFMNLRDKEPSNPFLPRTSHLQTISSVRASTLSPPVATTTRPPMTTVLSTLLGVSSSVPYSVIKDSRSFSCYTPLRIRVCLNLRTLECLLTFQPTSGVITVVPESRWSGPISQELLTARETCGSTFVFIQV